MSDTAYRSFIEQTLHYFNRPHEGAIEEPVRCMVAWKGSEIPPLEELAYRLSDKEVEEFVSAVDAAEALGRPTKELSSSDFPLPLLGERIEARRGELASGLGLQVVHGVPVDSWSQEQAELFFFGVSGSTWGGRGSRIRKVTCWGTSSIREQIAAARWSAMTTYRP